MKIGVLLSGNGVYDGSEIHEAVLSLLAIDEAGAEWICLAPNYNQHHVINHTNGQEMPETRNILIEAARIARGNIKDIEGFDINEIDGLVMPGGFGAAKNFTQWAFKGPEGPINPAIKDFLIRMIQAGKPIAALCVSPVVLAKALEGSNIHPKLTLGTDKDPSPYDIKADSEGLAVMGAQPQMKTINEILVDEENKLISAPCYMMEVSIKEVRANAKMAIDKLIEMTRSK
ncbi:isoprenoid biosynthesis glyoxalase ElbB [Oscillatoria amoena NRMC-F 0135]|nr:isoprenoid biosynthesis glyoxalase ElbB [Oscillatoria amoena NRMC-F 0135]